VPALGEDAFAWRQRTAANDEQRDETWRSGLRYLLEYLSKERDPDAYLFTDLDEVTEQHDA